MGRHGADGEAEPGSDAAPGEGPVAPSPVILSPAPAAGQSVRGAEAEAACRRALPSLSVDGACVVVVGPSGNKELIHATDPVGAQLDELQFTLGEGPGHDAYRTRSPVLVEDLEAEQAFGRWPGFAHEATQTGARAVFAFPLQFGARPIPFGTVAFYRRRPGDLGAAELGAARLIVDDLVRAVLADLTGHGQLTPTTIRPEPMFGHSEVAQATGMISVQLDVSIPQALVRLRAAAFAEHRQVADLAADVLARRRVFGSAD